MNQFWLAVCLAVTVPSAVFAQADSLSVKKSKADPKRFDCDVGFATFTTPTGWSVNRSNKPTYAIFTPADEAYPKVTKMISIDAGKPTGEGAKGTAEGMAKKFKGQVLPQTMKIDGADAYMVKCEADAKQLKPVECVVMAHKDKVVMLIAGATKDDAASTAIKELIATWKWK